MCSRRGGQSADDSGENIRVVQKLQFLNNNRLKIIQNRYGRSNIMTKNAVTFMNLSPAT
jgi:hypothetical protein